MKEELKREEVKTGEGWRKGRGGWQGGGGSEAAVASGEGSTLGHFCQDVDEVVQP